VLLVLRRVCGAADLCCGTEGPASDRRCRDDSSVSVKRRAETALCDRLRSFGVEVDASCRAEHLRQVVVDTVDDASLGQSLTDLREGSGGELTATLGHRPKFHSAYSSCALAVNAFGPWRLDTKSLAVDGDVGFTSLRFEAQRPIFGSRATPPNLDVLIESDDQVVAIESKLTEYLVGNEHASFADRYDEVVQELADPSWRDLYALLKAEPGHYAFVNADQLLKHYLGLKRGQRNDPRPITLIYLYWEPADAERHDAFAQHRREAEDLERRVDDQGLVFRPFSYGHLWQEWQRATVPRMEEHVARLRDRYAVSILD
jgi:restriction endonuclease-like protein